MLTDGLAISIANLLRVDSEVQDIAASCQPPITLPDVRLDAQQEACSYLLKIGARYFGRGQTGYNGPDYYRHGTLSLYAAAIASNRSPC